MPARPLAFVLCRAALRGAALHSARCRTAVPAAALAAVLLGGLAGPLAPPDARARTVQQAPARQAPAQQAAAGVQEAGAPAGVRPGLMHTRPEQPAPRAASVEMRRGWPTIVINGTDHRPMIYALTDVPAGRWSWEELPRHNIEQFCERGIRLFQVDLFLEHLWMEDGSIDLGRARRQIAGVQRACPEGSVFIRFHLRAPRWWLRAHPDEWVAYADTSYVPEQGYGLLRIIEDDNHPVRRVSMASTRWRAAVSDAFRQVLRRLAKTPEGGALAGLQVANGVYGEWHNWGFYRNEPDVSAPMTRAFRRWLRQRYGTEAALRAAWGNPDVRFETASVPGLKGRATAGTLRDPSRERRAIDYYDCAHEQVADNILHFARIAKAEWPRPLIVGTFYGYYFSVFGRQAAGGHLELQRILRSDAIDYLAGPQAYEPESIELGDPYRSRSLIASVRLHGKLWLDEMDVEPRIPMLRDPSYDRRLRESIADVRRNVAFSFTKGMGLWFYDFGVSGVDLDGFAPLSKGSQGTWDHPAVLEEIERMKALFDTYADRPYRSAADVLFVYDTESYYYSASLLGADPVTPALVDHNTLSAFRSGVVFDPVHLDDLSRVDLSAYRTVVFGNTYVLSDEERAFVREQVAAEGRHVVWFYAPGLLEPVTPGEPGRPPGGADRVSALTQIRLAPYRPPAAGDAPAVEVSVGPDSTVRYRLDGPAPDPLFAVDDPDAAAIGRFVDTGQTAIASREYDDHTAWYVALPSRQPDPLRYILGQTGAHVYVGGADLVYGGGGLLVLHTASGGRRTLTLRDGTTLPVDLPDGPATVFVDAETGTVLRASIDTAGAEATVSYE
jgi:hypothetical protein